MQIIAADISDAQALTDLTIRSKSHWNYGIEQIEKWRSELTIRPDYIVENGVYKLLANAQLVGYYSYFMISHEMVKLDNLFIEPTQMKKGFGKALLTDLIERVKQLGCKKVTLDSDPHAESFYKRMRFSTVGQLESSIKDRFLPIMEKEI